MDFAIQSGNAADSSPASPSGSSEVLAALTHLLEQGTPPKDFLPAVLRTAANLLKAEGVTLWQRDQQQSLIVQIEWTKGTAGDPTQRSAEQKQFLGRVFISGNAATTVISCESESTVARRQVVAAPVACGTDKFGVLEAVRRVGEPAGETGNALTILTQLAQLAGASLASLQQKRLRERFDQLKQLDQFTQLIHESVEPLCAFDAIASEAAHVLNCDRLALVVRSGKQIRVRAISGQQTIEARSSVVQRIQQLSTAVIASGQSLWLKPETEVPTKIAGEVRAHFAESGAKQVILVPLPSPRGTLPPSETSPAIGAIVIEQFESANEEESFRPLLGEVTQRAAAAVTNVVAQEQIFLRSLWVKLGQASTALRGRRLAKFAMIIGALLLFVVALRLIPAELKLTATGKLQPAERRNVFAAVSGRVEVVHVKHGDVVREGDLLAELRNVEIDVQLASLQGRRRAAEERLKAVETSLLASPGRSSAPHEAAKSNLHRERRELERTLVAIEQQTQILAQQQSQLKVFSPAAGQVVTWNLAEKLLSRPVESGTLLMTIIAADRPWELELAVPEQRVGHLLAAQARGETNLPVTYLLASEPAVVHRGEVKEVRRTAEVRDVSEGNVVLVKAKVDAQQHAASLTGAEVTAKIHCGQASLGYVLLQDLIAFVQSRILFFF